MQRFGYPLQVLPFGHAAGHYRDITALVATKHPTRIPLAYMYREGDYSTQVDMLILTWRVWDDSYFPPPHDPIPQEDPQGQADQENTVSANSSSSASSNNAPSEPTIDYSSWSPRSYSVHPVTTKKWIPKIVGARQENTVSVSDLIHHFLPAPPTPARSDLPLLLPPTNLLRRLRIAPSDDGPPLSQLLPSQTQYPPATEDPFCSHTLRCTYSAAQTHTPSAPNLILINSLFSFQVQNCVSRTLLVARENYPSPHAIPLLCLNPSLSLTLGDRYISPTQMMLLALLKEYCKLFPGPLKPTNANSPLPLFTSAQAHFENTHSPPPTLTLPEHTGSPQGDFSLSPLSQQEDCSNTDPTRNGQLIINPNLLEIGYQENLSPVLSTHLTSSLPNPSDGPVRDLIAKAPLMPISNLSNLSHTALSPSSPQKQKEKRGKERQQPTRRSERIQAKRQTDNTVPKTSVKNCSRMKGIQFELDSPDTPLDVSTTLAILQAFGLEINKGVEEMVQQATKQANNSHNSDSDAPPTPLHDPIPPLTIPGFDLPL